MSTYAFESERRIVCQVRSQGIAHLATIDPQGGHLRTLHTPFTAFSPYIQAHSGRAFTIAGSPTEPIALIAVGTAIGWGLVTNTAAGWLSWQGYLLGPVGLGGKSGAWAFANLGVLVALAIGFAGALVADRSAVRVQEAAPASPAAARA